MHAQMSARAGGQPTLGLKRTASAPGGCRFHQHECIPEASESHDIGLKLLFHSIRYPSMLMDMPV